MSILITPSRPPEIEYPASDGQPMAENTLQFQWIVTIKEGLEALFRHDRNVFVAGDLFWYPEEGKPKVRTAPDAMLAFGRPQGHRGSYKQWEEAGIAPQVVFEVLSPSNRPAETIRKFRFYELLSFASSASSRNEPGRLTDSLPARDERHRARRPGDPGP